MLRFYTSPYKLKGYWESLYFSSSSVCTPFQSYEANECYYKVYNLKGSRRKYTPVFAYHTDGKNQCIVPLIVSKKEKILRNFSSFGPIDYYHIIASSYEESYIRQVLREICAQYPNFAILFENIPEDSILYAILSTEGKNSKEICVHIPLVQYNNLDEYIHALSKHQRQNIRTAYNKLARNSIRYHLEAYDKTHAMPKFVQKQCAQMYESRYEYKFGIPKTHPILKWLMRRLRRWQDPLNRIISSSPQNSTFVLFYNDTPVAYLSGFYNQEKTCFYVPRLTCHVDYLSYDPGILMLLEVIKKMKENNVKSLDLTRGDEPYKYAIGGVEHYNYTLTFNTNNHNLI